jgi:hypothetical protein
VLAAPVDPVDGVLTEVGVVPVPVVPVPVPAVPVVAEVVVVWVEVEVWVYVVDVEVVYPLAVLTVYVLVVVVVVVVVNILVNKSSAPKNIELADSAGNGSLLFLTASKAYPTIDDLALNISYFSSSVFSYFDPSDKTVWVSGSLVEDKRFPNERRL